VSEKLFVYQRDAQKSEAFARTLVQTSWVKHLMVSGSVVVSFIVFSLALPWQQTSQGQGRVLALSPDERPQVISAPVDARIEKWYVVEGQQVKAGQKIAKLADLDQKIIDRLMEQTEAIRQKVKATEVLVETSRINTKRTEELFKQGLISQREGEEARREYAEALIDAANAQGELARAEISLSRQLSQEITSPMDGSVMSLIGGQGTAIVKAGDVLATLVPLTESRVVELLVDANDLPLVEINNKVRLQFEGWPAIQFSGAPDLAYGTFSGLVSSVDPYDMDRGLFRLIVKPDESVPDGRWPTPQQLRQGVRVKGWVLLNVVTLGYEIWRRMNGFPASREKPLGRAQALSGTDPIKPDKESGKK